MIHELLYAFQAGGVDYIAKPFHPEEVLARVENQLRLLNDILDMAKIEAGQVQLENQPFDLGAMVRSTDFFRIMIYVEKLLFNFASG
jgi:DNA-binding response OmpR family regulator